MTFQIFFRVITQEHIDVINYLIVFTPLIIDLVQRAPYIVVDVIYGVAFPRIYSIVSSGFAQSTTNVISKIIGK